MTSIKKHLPLRVISFVLAILILVVIGYVGYVFIDYHRIPDNQEETIQHAADPALKVESGVSYTALSYNIGFGAYTPDYSFFMDGGKSSWANSKESVINCTNGDGQLAQQYQPDFVLFQEMDLNSTRSYHVNQKAILDEYLTGYDNAMAINFDSPFLFYPFTQPHGKSVSGIALYARYPMTAALRRSFPITTSLQRMVDLDRCYLVSRFPMADGRELVIYTVHMTAYTSDMSVRPAQIAMLIADMSAEYESGNAVICGGDFNTEMIDTEYDENTASWAHPLERDQLGVFLNAWDQIPETRRAANAGTCRDAGTPYTADSTEWTVDSFLVSPNVVVEDMQCIDMDYLYSDHNPVRMTFHIE